MARQFPSKYKEFYRSNSCIYKVTLGTKYYLVKAKALKQSVDYLMEDIDRKIRLGVPDGHIISKVVKHIQSARPSVALVEVLFESNDQAALIDFESKLLKAAESDPKCLNTSFVPYFPAWISKEVAENFNKGILQTPVPATVKKISEPVKIKKTIPKEKKPAAILTIPAPQDIIPMEEAFAILDKINAAKDLKARN